LICWRSCWPGVDASQALFQVLIQQGTGFALLFLKSGAFAVPTGKVRAENKDGFH
jgi:hypothetical protein